MTQTAERTEAVRGGVVPAAWAAGALEEQQIDVAILRTLIYADIFDYPLTVDEISHWAIGAMTTPHAVAARLECSRWLAERVECAGGYVTLRGRSELVPVRERRRRSAQALWRAARRYGCWLARLPFVRMLAVTGALALDNADEGEDVDLLIVTAPGRVWLVRALAIVFVRLARLQSVELCPNYVLSENALAQQRRDLYAAHEMVQMAPLAGHALFERMLALNEWCREFMPNACAPWHAEPEAAASTPGRALQRMLELALGGALGDRLERWERARKLRRFAPQAAQPGASAIVDEQQIKGHFKDYGGPTLRRYYEKLREFGIEDDGSCA